MIRGLTAPDTVTTSFSPFTSITRAPSISRSPLSFRPTTVAVTRAWICCERTTDPSPL